MDKQKLIEYLEHIVELEKQRYAQKTAMNELQKQIDSLGNKDNIERKLAHVEPKKVDLLGIGGFIGLGVFCIIAFNAISDCHYISFGSLLLRLALAAVAGYIRVAANSGVNCRYCSKTSADRKTTKV